MVDNSTLGLTDRAALGLLDFVAAELCQTGLLVDAGNMVDCSRSIIPNRNRLRLERTGHGMMLLGSDVMGKYYSCCQNP